MPINYSISPAQNLVIVAATGVCTREDMDRLRAQLLADDRIAAGMKMLFETTEVDSRLSFTDLQEIAGRLGGIFGKGINKVAVVADSRFIYSMAKTFRVFAANQPVQMCPFRNLAEAVIWLYDGALNAEVMELAEITPQSIVERESSFSASRKAS